METGEILIIVDMINGFVTNGALADPDIGNITEEIERLAIQHLEKGNKVIAFKDCHNTNSPELNNFPPHCMENTEEVELVDALKKYENKFLVLEKNSTSGFMVSEFFDYIREADTLKKVIITGCCTDICILNLAIPLKNFFNQKNRNVEIIVPRNAVDTYNIPHVHDRNEWSEMAFRLMNQAGVQIVESL